MGQIILGRLSRATYQSLFLGGEGKGQGMEINFLCYEKIYNGEEYVKVQVSPAF